MSLPRTALPPLPLRSLPAAPCGPVAPLLPVTLMLTLTPPVCPSCPPSGRRSGIRWDEDNIKATFHPEGKDYGHMKINEPDTPYEPPLEPEDDVPDFDLDGSAAGGAGAADGGTWPCAVAASRGPHRRALTASVGAPFFFYNTRRRACERARSHCCGQRGAGGVGGGGRSHDTEKDGWVPRRPFMYATEASPPSFRPLTLPTGAVLHTPPNRGPRRF